jgi:hypothetical protein
LGHLLQDVWHRRGHPHRRERHRLAGLVAIQDLALGTIILIIIIITFISTVLTLFL